MNQQAYGQQPYNSGNQAYGNNIYDQRPISNPLKNGFGGNNSQAYGAPDNRNSGGYTRDQGQYKGTIGGNNFGNPTQFQFK